MRKDQNFISTEYYSFLTQTLYQFQIFSPQRFTIGDTLWVKVFLIARSHILINVSPSQSSPHLFQEIVTQAGKELRLNENSDELFNRVADGNFLPHMHNQLRLLYKSIIMDTCYGNYPFLATLKFFQEVNGFIAILHSRFHAKSRNIEVKLHQQSIYEQNLYRLRKRNIRLTDKILNEPMESFYKYKSILHANPNGKLPIFGALIKYLLLLLDY